MISSRERVHMSVEGREPDRVPIDLGGTRQSGIMASSYHQLKEALGLKTPSKVFDVYQMLAEVERPIMERFHVDVVGIYKKDIAFGIRNERWKKWRLFDGTEVLVPGDFDPSIEEDGSLVIYDKGGKAVGKMPKDGFYFDKLEKGPGAAHVDLDNYSPLDISDEELEYLKLQAKYWWENSEYAIMLGFNPGELFFNFGAGDFSRWLITLMTEEQYVRELYEISIAKWISNLKKINEAVGEYVFGITFSDDLGTQAGEFLSPDLFSHLIAPYYKKVFDWIHANTRMKVFFHSCGSIVKMIPKLIEVGVDLLNPVQISAKNMEPEFLKSNFGDKITFWGGGCDPQKTLRFGTSTEVREEVKRNITAFMPGGKYVLSPVHNIQQNVPVENIIALFDAAYEYGKY